MCTALTLHADRFYFGRNMDMEGSFGERVVVTPRNYSFAFRKNAPQNSHYAMIGMAAVIDGYPLYADAVNERGLCMAGLNFPGNAYYPCEAVTGKLGLTPFELIPWILGRCSDLEEAKHTLLGASLISIPFREDIPLTPLHWIISHKSGSLTVESTKEGLNVYENPVGVLTNNPPFDFHLWNLQHYQNLTAQNPESDQKLFSLGLGAVGLPGDYSSASRFVKAVYLKRYSETLPCGLSQFFRILDSVAPVYGCVKTKEGAVHYTTYSCCMDAEQGIYHYTTYWNRAITAVDLHRQNINDTCLFEFPVQTEQTVFFMN